VPEYSALSDPDWVLWCADDDAVFQDGRVVSDAYGSTPRPDDQALRQDCPSADVYVTQERGRASDLRPGLVGQKLIEAHRTLSFPALRIASPLAADPIRRWLRLALCALELPGDPASLPEKCSSGDQPVTARNAVTTADT
jgi:hypothetical protein